VESSLIFTVIGERLFITNGVRFSCSKKFENTFRMLDGFELNDVGEGMISFTLWCTDDGRGACYSVSLSRRLIESELMSNISPDAYVVGVTIHSRILEH
jgi:hypothetical protein